MNTANKLLKITAFLEEDLAQVAKNAFSPSLQKIIDNALKKLDKISEAHKEKFILTEDQDNIREIYFLFKKSFSENSLEKNFNEIRNLRKLSYSLDYSENSFRPIIQNTEEIRAAINLFERNWRYNFVPGLFSAVLKNWGLNYNAFVAVKSFLFQKIDEYDGAKSNLLKIKENLRYVAKQNGALVLGAELAIKKEALTNSLSYFNLSDAHFCWDYFSDVIFAYYDKRKTEVALIFDDLKNALNLHNKSKTLKKLISKMIIYAENERFFYRKDDLKNLALEKIGDPEITSKWSIDESFSVDEKNEIFNAKNILNVWITNEFISVFFEKCINEPSRKKFWLNMAKHVQSFKVLGGRIVKRKLAGDSRIAAFLPHRFKECKGGDVAALVMFINDYVFIEFSDSGKALYAYKKNSSKMPKIQDVYSISSFIDGSIPLILYADGRAYSEGRFLHKENWEDKLKKWMISYAEINV